MMKIFYPIIIFFIFLFYSGQHVIFSKDQKHQDPRNIKNGYEIPSKSYADQPYVVKTPDGKWLCIMTTGAGHEGAGGQHIIATKSSDKGKSWSQPVEIESATGPAASWGMPLLTPFGRVYVFYDYNGDNALPDKRNDMLGWYCYKYSDDLGETWSSERFRLPVRVTDIDLNNGLNDPSKNSNIIQMFWGIGKPIIAQHKNSDSFYAIFGFSKIGKYLIEESEGWLFRSDNILYEKDPEKIEWTMLPKGENPIKATKHGKIQEEHNLVALSNGDLYCMYRTTQGYPVNSYSRDGGHSWTLPEIARYSPGGRPFKHPRACPRIWRCDNGKYLFWSHNHSGRSYEDRNPAWIVGGVEKDGAIHWSQPEILLYDLDPKVRTSYPDLIEHDGKYWITETQKEIARVHIIDNSLLEGLWDQVENNPPHKIIQRGLVCDWQPGDNLNIPKLPFLDKEGSFTIECWLNLASLGPEQVLFDNRDNTEKGILIKMAYSLSNASTTVTIRLEINDGENSAKWDVDPGFLSVGRDVHIVFICDGGPNIISVVANGQLNDGGNYRQYGFGRFSPKLNDVNGRENADIANSIKKLRIYNRNLKTAEVVENYRAGM